MLKCALYCFTFLSFALMQNARAIISTKLDISKSELNRLYCLGHFDEYYKKLKSTSKDNIFYFENQFLPLATAQGEPEMLELIANYKNEETMTNEERVILALSLLHTYSQDFDKIGRLINFHSNNLVTEKMRNMAQGLLHSPLHTRDGDFSRFSQSLENLPYLDEEILSYVFLSANLK